METSTDSTSGSQAKPPSFGRFLYTQNPFYLLSCGFVMYGLLVASSAMSDVAAKASFLTTSLGSYAALMALTAIAVIRWGKVWDDARTILLVVVIALLAYSVAVDELCFANPVQSSVFLMAGLAGAFVISEIVLRLCQIRFALWYRIPYYALLAAFFGSPAIAGLLRAANHPLANWSPLLFSMIVAAAMLLLIPAVRAGSVMASGNGTPWNWPLYPISLFVIIAVIAAVRSHAIWMSFGSLKGDVLFEPLLLLPILLAFLVLCIESAIARKKHEHFSFIMVSSTALLICGATSFADRPMPFDSAIAEYGGSCMTVTLVMLITFYAYTVLRRLPLAAHALPLSVWLLGVFGKEPQTEAFESIGLQTWMFAALACGVYFLLCHLIRNTEWIWFAFTLCTAGTIILASQEFDQGRNGLLAAFVWLQLMFMFCGAIFNSWLANGLRFVAGCSLVIATIGATIWIVANQPPSITAVGIASTGVLSGAYCWIVRRRAWIYVAMITSVCFAISITHVSALQFGLSAFQADFWQLKLGAMFFGIGIAITSAKTGIYHRKWKEFRTGESKLGLQTGF